MVQIPVQQRNSQGQEQRTRRYWMHDESVMVRVAIVKNAKNGVGPQSEQYLIIILESYALYT